MSLNPVAKKTILLQCFLLTIHLITLTGCSENSKSASSEENTPVDLPDTIALPDTAYASVQDLDYKVIVVDSVHSGQINDYSSQYDSTLGVLTFRGGPLRDARFGGRVKGTPSRVEQVWMHKTDYSIRPTRLGTWGGGTGWTGQPLLVHWPDSVFNRFKRQSPGLTEHFSQDEIIVASLCARVYFLNPATGEETRRPLDAGNPSKGTMMLDPTLNGNLYMGQAVPFDYDFGRVCFNLFQHKQVYFDGNDKDASRGWSGSDSSPLRVGDFVFWPAENGLFYKYRIGSDGSMSVHSKLHYIVKGDAAAGIESSVAVYKNYGYFGDNHGDVLCVNLNTMRPVWHYDNVDDIDASLVCEVVNGVPYLYCGCEVDRQGDSGKCRFVKLNGLTGRPEWTQEFDCHRQSIDKKHFDGGCYATPLLGEGDCRDLIFASICQQGQSKAAQFTAINRATGKVVYQTRLNYFSWSSPVAFYNERNELFIFVGDSSGFGYLIKGRTGEILWKGRLANNFESSPVVMGDSMVVGSRGQEIYCFRVV